MTLLEAEYRWHPGGRVVLAEPEADGGRVYSDTPESLAADLAAAFPQAPPLAAGALPRPRPGQPGEREVRCLLASREVRYYRADGLSAPPSAEDLAAIDWELLGRLAARVPALLAARREREERAVPPPPGPGPGRRTRTPRAIALDLHAWLTDSSVTASERRQRELRLLCLVGGFVLSRVALPGEFRDEMVPVDGDEPAGGG